MLYCRVFSIAAIGCERPKSRIQTIRGRAQEGGESMTAERNTQDRASDRGDRVEKGKGGKAPRTQYPKKLASIFEPHTEIFRQGKASKPTEFRKMVQIQEAED
jgi:hypothetical protein